MRFLRHPFKPINWFVCFSTLLFGMVFIPDAFAEDVTIICNKSVPETYLSKNDLRNIYLGKKRGWDNGETITIATLEGGDAHNYFCKTYIKKSTSQFGNYWKHMQFTGKGQIPKAFDTEQEMIDFVSNTKGAIGYISTKQKPDNVKMLPIK